MSDVEEALRERTRELAARIKELNCLYRVSDLLQRESLDLTVKLRQLPGLLISGLRFPEVARVLIEADARRFDVDWGEPRGPVFTQSIEVGGQVHGAIHVAYGPDADGPSIGSDERALVQAVALRVGVMLDRHRAEGERLALEEQLRQSQKMEAIGRLAGGIAHDFNNLLTSIKGLSSLALNELEAGHPIRPDLEEIVKASQRATGLTRQLLAFSRKQLLQLVPVDLNAAVLDLETMLRRVLREGVALRASYDHTLPPVIADPSQLDQVVMNLVVNAQDAMPHGGTIELITTLERVPSERAQIPAGEYALLTVRDSGVGIPPEHLDKVFEPFFTTKSAGEGTGLGLATVFGIVQQGGGFIDVESRIGVGSTFRVYLPLAGASAVVDTPVERPAPPAGGTETVLVAEDDASVRRLVDRILGSAGYHVLSAESAEQALALAEAHQGRVDLLLTDVVMPRIGGEQLHGRIVEQWPGVRVLYMSGYTDDPVVRREAQAPEGAYLAKPFPPELLLAKVRRALDREPQTLSDR